MDKENILKVADAIEQHSIPDLGFNMSSFVSTRAEDKSGHSCGTTACIAGWAWSVKRGRAPKRPSAVDLSAYEVARKFMRLNVETADALFYAFGLDYGTHDKKATPERAVAVLRHLAETGEVDWHRQAS